MGSGDGRVWRRLSRVHRRPPGDHPGGGRAVRADTTDRTCIRTRASLTALIDVTDDLIAFFGADGRIGDINRAWARVLGAQPADLIGRRLEDVYPPGIAADRRCTFDEVLATGRAVREEYPFGERWLDAWQSPIIGPGGRLLGVAVSARDITARKAIEEALRDSEARLRNVVDTMPVLINALDDAGNFVAWNRECERVTGRSAAEILHNPGAWELLYPDAADRAARWAEFDWRGPDYRDWESEIIGRDGEARTIAWSVPAGEFPVPGWAVWGIGMDVTERRRAETALRESEARFRAVFEQAGVGMVAFGVDGRIRQTNPAFRAMLGFGHEELVWLGWEGIAHAEDPPFDCPFRPDCPESNHFRGERRFIRRDGGIVWADMAATPVRREDGTVQFFIALAVDISEARRATEGLRRSEARIRAILGAVPDLLMVFDRDGTVVQVLSGNHPDLSVPAEKAEGQPVDRVYPRRIAVRFRHAIAQVLHTGEPQKLQYACRNGGEQRHFDAWFAPADFDQVLACIRDITDRVRMERNVLKAKKQAEAASAAKTRFLAAASHDLRQPLQALTLFVSVLAHHPGLDARSREIIGRIEASLDTFRDLLNGLLDISKLEAGLVSVHKAAFAVDGLFARLANDCAPLARAKGLRFAIVPTAATCHTDPALLERILRNLLVNAVRYTERGGIVVGCRRSGADLWIQICDTGIGIPADKLQAIFREFYQVGAQGGQVGAPGGAVRNGGRSPGAGGTIVAVPGVTGGGDHSRGLGLGLAIVDRLVRLLGLRVRVRSEPGRGSIFEVEVPRTTPVIPRRPAAPAAATAALADACVLAIDDEVEIRRALRLLLTSWGCRVVTAGSVAQALARVKTAGPPDLVIADYRLGEGQTGSEAVVMVQRLLGRPVPAILITGDTGPRRLRDALRTGLRLLHKPVKPDELRALVTEMLSCRPVTVNGGTGA